MLQAGRSRNAGGYRFGFNGMEQTKGVQGDGAGTFYDYKNRDYDPWKIRFNRVDPIAAQYHGLGLEHPYVATSDIYEEYKKVAMHLHDMMGKTLGPCSECEEINQNLSTTVEIPPFEFNGIPTTKTATNGRFINTAFGDVLLFNLHNPTSTGPQGTQLIDAQLNSGINRIRRDRATPAPALITPLPAPKVIQQ